MHFLTFCFAKLIFTLLQRQFRARARGQNVGCEVRCGGCGGHIVSSEESTYCDTFIFNCKHTFHIECLVDDENGAETKCFLCYPN